MNDQFDIENQLAASSVTFRDESLDDALRRLRGLGFMRIDLLAIRHYCDHFDPLLVSVGDHEAQRVRAIVDEYGVQVVSMTTYPANPLGRNLNGDDWVAGIDAYMQVGRALDAHIAIFPPGTPAPMASRWRGTAEMVLPWLREAARRALSANMRPAIALQSNSLLRTSENGLDFLKLLNMPDVGLAVDTAHLTAMGEDPAKALRRMGDAVAYVMLRDTDGQNFNLPPGGGFIDFSAVLDALARINYTGPLTLSIDDVDVTADRRAKMLSDGRDFLLASREKRQAA